MSGFGRKAWAAVALTAILLSAAPGLRAQETTGRLSGRVVDEAGNPLEMVTVTVTGPALAGSRRRATDSRGVFQFLGLPVGVYDVRFERIGLRTIIQTDAEVRLGRNTVLAGVTLEVQAIEMAPLSVVARPQAFDPTSAAVGFDLPLDVFEQLPIGRDYSSMIEMMPMANGSAFADGANIGGATGLENEYLIDGVNVTDGYRATGGTRLPHNFVEEIQLNVGGYEAEFAGALGGTVNVLTRSGGDEPEVGGYAYFTNQALSATPRPLPGAVPSEASSTYDLGVHVGGPIARGKLRFFGAYNPFFERQDIRVERFGLQPASLTRHTFAGKLDWTPVPGASVTLSVFGDPTSQEIVAPNDPISGEVAAFETLDPALGILKTGGVNASLIARTRLGSATLLEATLARHNDREIELGATEKGRTEGIFLDTTTDPVTLSGGYGILDADLRSSRTDVRLGGTLFLGSHVVKVGFEYQDTELDAIESGKGRTGKSPGADGTPQYVVDVWERDIEVGNRVPAAYLQDSWQVTPRLYVNAGMRWSAQYLVGSDGDVAQRFENQFQPRLGFAFQPGEMGTQKVFGSFARYYYQMPLWLSAAGHAKWDYGSRYYGPHDPRLHPDSVQSELVIYDVNEIDLEEVDGASTDHVDEFSLGYERAIGERFTVRLSGLHRVLRDNFQFSLDPEPLVVDNKTFIDVLAGNPGSGDLAHLPETHRSYWGLELTGRWRGSRGTAVLSYVLSRNSGDYSGVMAQEVPLKQQDGPNNNLSLLLPQQGVNADGPLPNDRTHVFKLSGAYAPWEWLTVGTFFTWQSGTPLNEFGTTNLIGGPLFLRKRGSAGRAPAIWDLNLRLTYDLPFKGAFRRSRAILDLLHLGNPQEIMNLDQFRYRRSAAPYTASYDEMVAAQFDQNPRLGEPIAFQPPFTLRLGIEFAM